MMTREEKLTTMTMACLAEIAKGLGIKIDKKGAKSKAVAKILEAETKSAEKTEIVKKLNKKQNEANEFTNISDADVEAEIAKTKTERKLVPMPGAEKLAELKEEYCGDGTPLAEVSKEIFEQAKVKSAKASAKKQKKEETDEELVAEVMKQKKELEIECPPIDPKKVKIVSEKSAKKSKKSDQVVVSDVSKILDYVYSLIKKSKDCTVGVPRDKNMKFRALQVAGKQFCKLMWSKKEVKLYFRCEAVKDIADNIKVVNYNLPYLYTVSTMNNNSVSNIADMFKLAIDSQCASKVKTA